MRIVGTRFSKPRAAGSSPARRANALSLVMESIYTFLVD